MYFSQQGEDEFIFANYLNQPHVDGTYIELGAVDGQLFSNTLFFERALGYTGVLIEPQRAMFEKLKVNRPNNHLVNAAVDNQMAGETGSFVGLNPTGGLTASMASSFREHWHSEMSPEDEYQVDVIPMSKIIRDAELEYVDLLSLDVEGGELGVLHSIDWDVIPIYLILIELDRHNRARNEECRSLLSDRGYESEGRIGINDIWLLPNYERAEKLFR